MTNTTDKAYGQFYTFINGKWETGNFLKLPRKKKKAVKKTLLKL